METIELHFDGPTFDRIRQHARERRSTPEQYLKEEIEKLIREVPRKDPFRGQYASISHILDQILEDAMRAREEHPLRQTGG
jgi:hypothetical protein